MNAPILRPRGYSLAVVVFTCSTLGYLRFLKPGFRHCMVALHDGDGWLLLDPLSNGLEVTRLGDVTPVELISGLTANGLVAIPVQRTAPAMRELPWAPFTCVETVKRVLALRARTVVTPWQLYRRLSRAGAARGDGRRRRAVNR